MTAAQASGKIKLYQSVVGGLLILNLPISYLFLKLGFAPQVTIYVSICISVIALYARLYILKSLVDLKVVSFFKRVVLKSLLVGLFAIIVPLMIYLNIDSSLTRFFILGVMSLIITFSAIYLLGLDKSERLFFNKRVLRILNFTEKHKRRFFGRSPQSDIVIVGA